MTGDASRFFSVRMSIVLTLFAAVLLSGMMVPSIAFGEETGVGHEAGAVDGGTQASTEAHGAADQDEDDSGSGNPHDPDAPSDEGAGSGGVSPSPAYVPGWNTVDGNRYFADEQGKLKSGWLIDGGKRYYLDPGNGNAMARGFVAIEGKSYYLDTDGVLFSSGWLLVDRAWYYAAASGEIETGWLKLGGTWYYLDPSRGGAMLTGSYRVGSNKQLGIDIGFETYDQMYSGVRVFGDPQPGDIILMYYGAWPNYNPMLPEHVVLYAGGGMIYEEPTFGGRCQYVSLASKGASTTTAQRILS